MAFDLEKAAASRLVLLSGPEETLKLRALRDLSARLGLGPEAFDAQEFTAGVTLPVEWFASVCTAPFFGDKRVAVVRHLLRCDPDKLKGVDLTKIPDTGLMILVAEDEGGDSDKQSSQARINANWEKEIDKLKGYVSIFKVDTKDELMMLKKEVIAMNKSASDSTLRLLLEITGSLSGALAELEKLDLYVGDTKSFQESDVKAVAVPSREWNVFHMVDALVQGNTGEAFGHLRTLLASAKKPEESIMQNILPQLSRTLRLTWQARIAIEAGGGLGNIPPSVKIFMNEGKSLLTEKDWLQRRYFGWAKNVGLPQLGRCLQAVSDADARLKGMLPGGGSTEVLDRLILEVAEQFGGVKR